MALDFAGLNARLLAHYEEILFGWFPNGRVVGHEFKIGDLSGNSGNSLSINLSTGVWKDFGEAGDSGSDPISLYAAIHLLTQGEAYKELAGDREPTPAVQAPAPEKKAVARVVLSPVPDYAPTEIEAFTFPGRGPPAELYPYKDIDGNLLAFRARYLQTGRDKAGKPRKWFCWWTWKAEAWRPEAPATPRPLYGLPQLKGMKSHHRVIVVEGEGAANALRKLVKQPVITWPDGASNPHKADWEPLRGKRVLIWPDADEPGENASVRVAATLTTLQCEVELVNVKEQPAGWDARDAQEAGWDYQQLREWLTARIYAWKPDADNPNSGGDVAGTQTAEKPNLAAQWHEAGLQLGPQGMPWCNAFTMRAILDYAKDVDGRIEIWYDQFLNRILYRNSNGKTEEWSDTMTTRLLQWVQGAWGLPKMQNDVVQRGVEEYAMRNTRNCVCDWLTALPAWDGSERLDRMLPEAYGTLDNDYFRAVGRCFIMGMVKRAMDPGSQVDNMPVFESKQGQKKSTSLRILGGEWFAEIHANILTQEFERSIQGKWLCEISELHSFRTGEQEAIKSKISDRRDRIRLPFGRYYNDYPRMSVFAGTTNRDDWNRDETGARRFWPVKCGSINVPWLQIHREQLYAEALHRVRAGQDHWDVPEDMAASEQAQRRPGDPWSEAISFYVDARKTSDISSEEILRHCLELKIERIDMVAQRRVVAILRDLGYIPVTIRDSITHRCRRMYRRYGNS